MRRSRRRGWGFTLVEMLITVVVIAILAAIAGPKFYDGALRSKEASLKAQLELARGAIDRFRADTGLLPESLADLSSESSPAFGLSNGNKVALESGSNHGPYLSEKLTDPVSGDPLKYSTDDAGGFQVSPSASGKASVGTDYKDW